MSSAGGIVSAVGTLIGGLNTQAAFNERARALRQQADQIEREAGVNAMSYQQDAQRAEATGFVSAAATGGVTGSAFDVLNEFAGTALFNTRNIVYQGQTRARNARYEANVAKVDGKNALISSAFNAASSILGGMDKGAEQAAMAGG